MITTTQPLDRANEVLIRAHNLNARLRAALGYTAPPALPELDLPARGGGDVYVYGRFMELLAWWDESRRVGLIETHPHNPWLTFDDFEAFVAACQKQFPNGRVLTP